MSNPDRSNLGAARQDKVLTVDIVVMVLMLFVLSEIMDHD